ncbi:hypothetical protein LWI29_008306 [Acer saccharum]|uniref:Uncharacterized protein n=1 Tax=Acer saccharum TaxID=4024 RepID=A0AA39SA38_ACESA|nr:hypothetical protein LWI29_008306 [Acer saccharum]KAK1564780.1 hypothetical protein Q3G72_011462 [Acer saccharum]
MEGTSGNISESGMVSQRKAFQGIQMENPFTLKAFQVFTGFGLGCGVGIGVGRPINLGAIPMVNQVMSATRGATDAFSGVSRHVNNALRKVGAKNIEVGVGCGVGFGHGFGIGLAVKPGVVHKIQSSLMQAMMKLMLKFGMGPNLSIGQGTLPMSLQSGMGLTNEPSNQSPMANLMQLATKVPDYTSQVLPATGNQTTGSTYEEFAHKSTSTAVDTSFGRTEKVLSNFLQNPILKQEGTDLNEVAGRLRSENNVLQMVLKHQKVIEELLEENDKLRQILVEDLKVPPSKLQASYSSRDKSACADCFECRRKQRKR